MTNPPFTSTSFDMRVVFITPFQQFLWWLVPVLIVSVTGYPGVVCVTPMAWLLALRVGNVCVARSRNVHSSRRILEATLAGAILGLLQGILFLVIVPFLGPYRSDEITRTILLTVFTMLVGILSGAGLAFITAYFSEQRKIQIEGKTRNV
jgi:hypothetical protein